jgi:Tfp pilus assembly protein PilE
MYVPRQKVHRAARRRGLTLLEMALVMAMLIALVGILVPLLPNLIYQAHTANGATNISELQKAMTTYHTCNLTYPDGYDSLLLPAGTVPTSMMWMGSSASQAIKDALTPYQLTATDVKSLKAAGITTVYNMADTATGASATFPGTVTPVVPLVKDVKLLRVSADLLTGNVADSDGNNVYGLLSPANVDAAATYIALGVGANCTLVGAANGGVAEAPIRGMPNNSADLNTKYGRYVAIFKVDTAGGSAATMVGCGCPGGNGMGTVGFLTNNYYNSTH